jgi:hypothetical protein
VHANAAAQQAPESGQHATHAPAQRETWPWSRDPIRRARVHHLATKSSSNNTMVAEAQTHQDHGKTRPSGGGAAGATELACIPTCLRWRRAHTHCAASELARHRSLHSAFAASQSHGVARWLPAQHAKSEGDRELRGCEAQRAQRQGQYGIGSAAKTRLLACCWGAPPPHSTSPPRSTCRPPV